MPNKKYKPTTPSRRYLTVTDFSVLTKSKPHKKLCKPIKKKAGRNNKGTITVRHRGGGSKRQYRVVDFKRTKNIDLEATVLSLEYDPNRTSFIMLVSYSNGQKDYLIAPNGISVGDKVVTTKKEVEAKKGNRMPIKNIPEGNTVYNLELVPGGGGKIVRSAGGAATLMSKEGNFAQLKFPSGEVRIINKDCFATVGQVSNTEHGGIVIGKAGRVRNKGKRPHVRGKAMNTVDHPHGGGEGRAPIGLVHPKTKWGKPALGVKTRKKNKKSSQYIIKGRKQRRR